MNPINTEQQVMTKAAAALKSIARRAEVKSSVEQNPQLYQLLQRAAARYVTGDRQAQALEVAQTLSDNGYAISLEYIGENTTTLAECEHATQELATLIAEMGRQGIGGRVSFDLSHIGLLLEPQLALKHLLQLGEWAQPLGIELFISMEESAKTDDILHVYRKAVSVYPLIGITLQAHLHRTSEDAATLLSAGTYVRLVKGAYEEPFDIALSRSAELDERYLELLRLAVKRGCHVSVATHDESLIEQVLDTDGSEAASIEFELLYGIRPERCVQLREQKQPVRVYLTYGQEWYLYLCHRIAEYPPNLFQALIDMVEGQQQAPVMQYVRSSFALDHSTHSAT